MALGFVSLSVPAWISTRSCDLSLIRVTHLQHLVYIKSFLINQQKKGS